MQNYTFLAALALLAGCGAPDPNDTGNIVGQITDGGLVTGCSGGQIGRTVWRTRLLPGNTPDGGHITVNTVQFVPWTRCCPPGTAFAECPARALNAAACTGNWANAPCSNTTVSTQQRSCSTTADCSPMETCSPVPVVGDSLTSTPTQVAYLCLMRCTLPTNQEAATCAGNQSICLLGPSETSDSRNGLCYPVR